MTQQLELFPLAGEKFVSIASIPKRCGTCGKPYTKTFDASGHIWFCANKNCTTRGFGYHQNEHGFIIDGVFNKAIEHLERYRF